MVQYSRGLLPTPVVCAILGGLLALADRADAQGLPGAPREDELDAALLAHHSIIYDRGLPNGRMVWFIVDANGKVLETGVGDSEGLEESLRTQYPDITSDFAFEFDHMTVEGRLIPLLWMGPEPPRRVAYPPNRSLPGDSRSLQTKRIRAI